MKKTYTAMAAFWRHGNLVVEGDPVSLTDAEAKYLKHALKETKTVTAPAPVAAPQVSDEPEAQTTFAVETVEADADDRPARKRK
jgi:hypothetical protein